MKYRIPKPQYIWLPFCLFFLVFLTPTLLLAAEATFSWLPNQEPGLAGYRIHYGRAPGNYDTTVDVGSPAPAGDGRIYHTISGLTPGSTYYFAATAYTGDNKESDYSQEVAWTVPEESNGGNTPGGNTPPVAVLSASPDSGTAPLVIILNASGSSDADGDQLSYIWSFGDGVSYTTILPIVIHSYNDPGTYTVTLRVEDGTTSSQAVSTVISVLPPHSGDTDTSPPEAVIRTDNREGTAPLTVQFNGSGSSSSAAGGGIVQYAWNFGDGTTASGELVQHTYTQAGSYMVTLVVTDTNSRQGRTTATITVTSQDRTPDNGGSSPDDGTSSGGSGGQDSNNGGISPDNGGSSPDNGGASSDNGGSVDNGHASHPTLSPDHAMRHAARLLPVYKILLLKP